MDENLLKRREDLRRKIVPLEWDRKLNQLHYGREKELKEYREELEKIELQMKESA